MLLIREQLAERGLDAGAETIDWHLRHHHQVTVSKTTIHRILLRAGAVVPEPKKRPRSSYIRFEAAMPNQTWQSDFTHYRLTNPDGSPGVDVEIISWLDDCTRYALHVSAHARVTTEIVKATLGCRDGPVWSPGTCSWARRRSSRAEVVSTGSDYETMRKRTCRNG